MNTDSNTLLSPDHLMRQRGEDRDPLLTTRFAKLQIAKDSVIRLDDKARHRSSTQPNGPFRELTSLLLQMTNISTEKLVQKLKCRLSTYTE